MSQANVEVVRRAHDAFTAGNIPALVDELDPEVRWSVPDSLPYGGEFQGHDEVLRFFARLPESFEALHVEVAELLPVDGDRVLDLGRIRGRGKDGGEVEAPYAFVWEMRDGKAAGFTEYSDTARIVEGLSGTSAEISRL